MKNLKLIALLTPSLLATECFAGAAKELESLEQHLVALAKASPKLSARTIEGLKEAIREAQKDLPEILPKEHLETEDATLEYMFRPLLKFFGKKNARELDKLPDEDNEILQGANPEFKIYAQVLRDKLDKIKAVQEEAKMRQILLKSAIVNFRTSSIFKDKDSLLLNLLQVELTKLLGWNSDNPLPDFEKAQKTGFKEFGELAPLLKEFAQKFDESVKELGIGTSTTSPSSSDVPVKKPKPTVTTAPSTPSITPEPEKKTSASAGKKGLITPDIFEELSGDLKDYLIIKREVNNDIINFFRLQIKTLLPIFNLPAGSEVESILPNASLIPKNSISSQAQVDIIRLLDRARHDPVHETAKIIALLMLLKSRNELGKLENLTGETFDLLENQTDILNDTAKELWKKFQPFLKAFNEAVDKFSGIAANTEPEKKSSASTIPKNIINKDTFEDVGTTEFKLKKGTDPRVLTLIQRLFGEFLYIFQQNIDPMSDDRLMGFSHEKINPAELDKNFENIAYGLIGQTPSASFIYHWILNILYLKSKNENDFLQKLQTGSLSDRFKQELRTSGAPVNQASEELGKFQSFLRRVDIEIAKFESSS